MSRKSITGRVVLCKLFLGAFLRHMALGVGEKGWLASQKLFVRKAGRGIAPQCDHALGFLVTYGIVLWEYRTRELC